MKLSSRVNRFIEERLGIHSYPIKVVLLFTLLIFISMFLAFVIDVGHSVGEVRNEIEKASQRAAKFRTTAIRNVVLSIFRADTTLARVVEREGMEALRPFVGTFIDCAVGEGFSLGRTPEGLLEKARRGAKGKSLYFYLDPDTWRAVSVVKEKGKLYLFCHSIPYIESILSKRLGAIAKYGAEFYFGKKPEAGRWDVLVVYENDYSNASMYVLVPFKSILYTLVGERVFLYMRLYFVFVLFLAVSYLLWARLVNYPIKRLREIVGELERGNYEVRFEEMLSAKDEFGGISRLLKSFSEDTRSRLDKLELILDTALRTVDTPEDVENFVRSTLERINRIFSSKTPCSWWRKRIQESSCTWFSAVVMMLLRWRDSLMFTGVARNTYPLTLKSLSV